MTQNLTTIEDLLEIAAGLKNNSKIQLESSDVTIMYSIARQVFRGTALTDRQHALMQEKLTKYRDQFTALDYKFDQAVNTLRQPLREIDRSKYIKIVDHFDGDLHVYNKEAGIKKPWICVRFPFSKSLIQGIESAKNNEHTYFHRKGSHEHYFLCNEKNVISVIDQFKDKGFDIDSQLIEFYEKLKAVECSPKEYIPGIFDFSLCNMHTNAEKIIKEELPDLNKSSLIYYIDRKRRYGIIHTDKTNSSVTSLTEKIAFREGTDFHCKPSEYKLENLFESLGYLDRFPLLVVLDETNAEQQLVETFNITKNLVDSSQQSVLMRLPGDEKGNSFNTYVREKKLNNWVDNNTKVVYINNNKLPKISLTANWKPIAALTFTSSTNRNVDGYINSYCDLVIFREEVVSPMRKYSRYYG